MAAYAGDTLWALAAFLGIGLLLPRASTWRVALLAMSFSVLVEVGQLYNAPWIDSIRGTTLGGLVLGFDFVWSDPQLRGPVRWRCGPSSPGPPGSWPAPIRQFRGHGHEVLGLVRSLEGEQLLPACSTGEPRHADLFDADALASAAEGAEVVIHAVTAIPVKESAQARRLGEN